MTLITASGSDKKAFKRRTGMDYQTWLNNLRGLAGIYSFNILEDGSFTEIRLMGVNQQNIGMITDPSKPEFYPGIPYRSYWQDINFERYVYKCGSEGIPLYSYVNAYNLWVKGFYLPITQPGTISAHDRIQAEKGKRKTVYCLYICKLSDKVESEYMSLRSPEISAAVMNINVKMHEFSDFYESMAAVTGELREICGTDDCSLYTIDKITHKCVLIDRRGVRQDILDTLSHEMHRTPYEIALAWENDLAKSDCIMYDDLSILEKRDPPWYNSLKNGNVRNIILYAVRFHEELVGFIWAVNFDPSDILKIKETLELTSFLIGAFIANYQLVSRLESLSRSDTLTQVNNRNAMNARIDSFISGKENLPERIGIVFIDLNGLKAVNDTEGHDAGDRLLFKSASILKIAFSNYEIYRAGGDEFVVFCPDISEEMLEQHILQLNTLMKDTPDVSFAVGKSFSYGDYDIFKAMQAADENMYEDKEKFYRDNPEKSRRRIGGVNNI